MPPDPSQIAERKLVLAHDVLMRTRGLQFDFQAPPQSPPPPDFLARLLPFLRELGPVFRFIFWGGLAVGAVLIVWFVVREVLGFRRKPKARGAEAVDWRPEPAAARALLEEADRLAQAERYGEAIRLLLHRSIEDLSARRPGLVRPALTSRDIAGLDAIPAPARSAFGRIAQAVERSLFGGRAMAAEDFRSCRGDYEAFAFAEAWR